MKNGESGKGQKEVLMGVGCGPNQVGSDAYLEHAEYLELVHVHYEIRGDDYPHQ